MSTRSVAHYFDGETLLCTVYRHHDGYPSGRGDELAEYLNGHTLVNGIRSGYDPRKIFNGADSMAAQCVAFEVNEGHSIRMVQAGNVPRDAEYVYEIHGDTMDPSNGIRLVCYTAGREAPLYDGDPDAFDGVAIEATEQR